jgi:flagellar biosynthesis GTPase FlhF
MMFEIPFADYRIMSVIYSKFENLNIKSKIITKAEENV